MYDTEVDTTGAKFSADRGDKFLDDISEERRKALLGVRGSEAWSNGDAQWENVMRNYQGQEKKTVQVFDDK